MLIEDDAERLQGGFGVGNAPSELRKNSPVYGARFFFRRMGLEVHLLSRTTRFSFLTA
jgi:hypothetical protein